MKARVDSWELKFLPCLSRPCPSLPSLPSLPCSALPYPLGRYLTVSNALRGIHVRLDSGVLAASVGIFIVQAAGSHRGLRRELPRFLRRGALVATRRVGEAS